MTDRERILKGMVRIENSLEGLHVARYLISWGDDADSTTHADIKARLKDAIRTIKDGLSHLEKITPER